MSLQPDPTVAKAVQIGAGAEPAPTAATAVQIGAGADHGKTGDVTKASSGFTEPAAKPASFIEKNDLDIAYFFSAPLVQEINGTPVEIPMLSVTQELKELRRALNCDRNLRFKSAVANVASFRTTLNQGARVVHFSAHGLKGQITFESRYGKVHPIAAKDLMDLFCAGDKAVRVQLVFVSACHSEDVGRAFLECGVPAVVAVNNNHAILDRASIQFAHGFYDALVQGHTTKGAFEIGKKMVQHDAHLCKSDEHSKFILLGKPEFQNRTIFPNLPQGRLVDISEEPSLNHSHVPDTAFVGRALLVQKTFETLEGSRRCVVLAGPKGIGKTQIALMACKYAAERSRYEEIFYVRLDDGKIGTAMQRFAHALKITATNELAFEEELQKFRTGRYLVLIDGFQSVPMATVALSSFPSSTSISSHASFASVDADDEADVALDHLLRTMLRTTEDMHFLVTYTTDTPMQSPVELSDVNHLLVPVDPLTPESAALAFCKHATRIFKHSEFSATGVFPKQNPMAVFGKSTIIRELKGNPHLIGHVARAVSTLNLVAEQDRILKEIIPNAKAKLFGSPKRLYYCLLSCFGNDNDATMLWMSLGVCAAKESVSWTKLGLALQQHFLEQLGKIAADTRPLSDADIAYIGQMKFGLNAAVDTSAALVAPSISPQMFAAFWQTFWKPWLAMMKLILEPWNSTFPIIAGFVHDRVLLKGGREGMFMLRFSFTAPNTLVCVFLDQDLRLQKTKIFVDNYAETVQFRIQLGDAVVIREPTLDNLLCRVVIWKTLYPSHPKERVFIISSDPPPEPPKWGLVPR